MLLDTAILVDLLRGHEPARKFIDSLSGSLRLVSFITVAELLCGCRNRREQALLELELGDYTWQWMNEATARLAIDLYREFRLPHGIGFHDCCVAATAIDVDVPLATTNVKHFAPIAQLAVIRPY